MKKYEKVLDHGFVGLLDHMGDDQRIVDSARVSYGDGTVKTSNNRTLIRYLMRNHHSTPFESVEFQFHIKAPIFVVRQWLRHRMASVNEISGRYSIMKMEFYMPSKEQTSAQSSINHQGRSSDPLSDHDYQQVKKIINNMNIESSLSYNELVSGSDINNLFEDSSQTSGVAREIARIILPLNLYSEFYWKIDLKNLMHFIHLREDPHAQLEIREYAKLVKAMISPIVPLALEAFNDYQVEGANFSKIEISLLKSIISGDIDINKWNKIEQQMIISGCSNREIIEFKIKLGQ